MAEHVSTRVNGKRLAEYVGRTVRLVCKVLQFKGDSALVETSDKMQVEVRLSKDARVTDTYVEVVGKVNDATTVTMMACINMGSDLDMELVDFTIETINDPRFLGSIF
ncbi:replication factor A protein 3 [Neolentinus lepideus HHB14362 ss-1]|uniref:Replication factor A protein 3 n=1 Tax=Neolentinus lepideus HHB14362 ss-1 TaxID=1314782 RepID=A0A165SUF7_9AGAM|nr:replication factor A protein 3 [Neolentinus lepideus HHB14362 ss-1]